MAILKPEGIFDCQVLDAAGGNVDGKAMIQVNVRIEAGAATGQRCTYEDEVTVQSSKYVVHSLKAIGWKGKTLTSLKADVEEWIKATGGKSTVEIKHLEIKRGKRAGQIWDKPNSIGRGMARPVAPLTGETLSDADQALRDALALDGGNDEEAPPDDYFAGAPESNRAAVDDIPF